jgi:hypothetical protein
VKGESQEFAAPWVKFSKGKANSLNTEGAVLRGESQVPIPRDGELVELLGQEVFK